MKSIAGARNLFFVLLWALLAGLSGMRAAAAQSPGITVSATGKAEAMPDTIELTATVVGNAELAGDAVEKYRSNKRRVVQSLEGLKIEGFTVVGSGLSIHSGSATNPLAAFQAGQANQAKVADKVAVQERLTVSISGIHTMNADKLLESVIRIVDVIKDAGLVIGPGPKSMIEMQLSSGKPATLATFKLSNTDSLRQKAYEDAMKQARSKAERLAQLAGVQLGDIISIREGLPVSKGDNAGGMSAYFAMIGMASSKQSEYTSTEFQSIPVTVSLSVQFEIVKKK